MQWFLILCLCVIVVILFVVNVYILVNYSHPDDKNEAYLPKALVVLGLLVSQACILALPLDKANNSGYIGCQQGWFDACGFLNMTVFWEVAYWLVAVLVIIVLPWAIFYYEADDGLEEGSKVSHMCSALKYVAACLFTTGIIVGVSYHFIGKTRLPVQNYPMSYSTPHAKIFQFYNVTTAAGVSPKPFTYLSAAEQTAAKQIRSKQQFMLFEVSWLIYLIGLLSFVGWFLFALFGGIGLAALPADLITSFIHRPKPLSPKQLADDLLALRVRVIDLVAVGDLIRKERRERRAKGGNFLTKAKGERGDRSTLNKFKQMVYLLEDDYETFQASSEYAKFNPLIPFGKLILGVICAVITTLWVVHIFLFMLFYPPQSNFLNSYFIQFDSWFPLFGTLSFAIFSLYLLLCVIAGNFKFGVRLVCFTLHPMKINGTYMNSFLFNVILLLICTFPIVDFCTTAFAGYARFTSIYQFFGVQLKYLVFFQYFYANSVFIYMILCIAVLSAMYFVVRPKDKAAKPEDVKKSISGRRKG